MAGRLIVVIDDDRDTRDAFAEWLELGGDVVVCADGAAAVEAGLAGRTPAVCIVDLQLTMTTGLEVFRDLRDRLAQFRDTVPIVLTGMNRSKAERLIEAGPMAGVILLTKPVDPFRLTFVIDSAVAAHSSATSMTTQSG
jgi:two-component system, OmpR family, response regulator